MAERIFKLPVFWTMSDIMEIKAETLDDAIEKAKDAPLPDGSYVSDSFDVDVDLMENKEGEPLDDANPEETETK